MNTVRAFSQALEIALPHLPTAVLQEITGLLAAETRLVPEDRSPTVLAATSIEAELGATWSSLGPLPTR